VTIGKRAGELPGKFTARIFHVLLVPRGLSAGMAEALAKP